MDQLRNFADSRLLARCIYCGGSTETREHVPSRVFLDSPRPENLPVVRSCGPCNNGFSADEEYLACLIEVAVAGSTDPDLVRRPAVAAILRRSPKLRARLEAARTEANGRASFAPEYERVRRVVVKLARGHSAFELSRIVDEEPTYVGISPVMLLSEDQWAEFEQPHFPEIFPEVGSRAMQRMLVVEGKLVGDEGAAKPLFVVQDWQDVQPNRYAYLASEDGAQVQVRILIGDYLACDIRWAH